MSCGWAPKARRRTSSTATQSISRSSGSARSATRWCAGAARPHRAKPRIVNGVAMGSVEERRHLVHHKVAPVHPHNTELCAGRFSAPCISAGSQQLTPSGPRSRDRQAARGIPQLLPRLSRQATAREFGENRLHGVAPIIAGIRLISEFIALPLAGALRRLRIVGGVGIVFGYSSDEPASGERLQVRLQRVSNLLGIDLPVVHV